MSDQKSIGIFGGTFDPVHRGHIAIAQDFLQHLQLDELRLVPCHLPPHRDLPSACDADRLAILRIAATGTPLVVDDRELRREGSSYTIDTLLSLRGELGNDCSLVLCLGLDAFARLDTWQQWQQLIALAHIAVATRAASDAELNPAVRDLLARKQTRDASALKKSAAGLIYLAQLSQIPVSSTQTRQELAAQRTARDLHPGVIDYIQQRGLYQSR
jgi:nicotinate-nucleotide adenylyltransferase